MSRKILPTVLVAVRKNDAARARSLCRSTLYKLMKSGKLRTVKVAGRRLVPMVELREPLKAKDQEGTKGAAR